MRRFHSPMLLETLRRERHRLEAGQIDRPQRDIVRLEASSARSSSASSCVLTPSLMPALRTAPDIGVIQIVLAEMDPGRALVDRDAPIVVDDQRRARLRADRQRFAGLARDRGLVLVLDAQLDEPRADADEPRDPGRAVDDRVEGVEVAPFSPGERRRERG